MVIFAFCCMWRNVFEFDRRVWYEFIRSVDSAIHAFDRYCLQLIFENFAPLIFMWFSADTNCARRQIIRHTCGVMSITQLLHGDVSRGVTFSSAASVQLSKYIEKWLILLKKNRLRRHFPPHKIFLDHVVIFKTNQSKCIILILNALWMTYGSAIVI